MHFGNSCLDLHRKMLKRSLLHYSPKMINVMLVKIIITESVLIMLPYTFASFIFHLLQHVLC